MADSQWHCWISAVLVCAWSGPSPAKVINQNVSRHLKILAEEFITSLPYL
jgi:hypothetical protein